MREQPAVEVRQAAPRDEVLDQQHRANRAVQGKAGAQRTKVMDELRRGFRPEFLNRVDEIVLFKPLRPSEIERIVGLLAQELGRRLASRRMTLELTPAARRHIAEQSFDPV